MHKTYLVAFVLFFSSAVILANIDDKCLRCICNVESGCLPKPCSMDVGSLSCGYYQLKKIYWDDCQKPSGSFELCAADKGCSEQCIRNYMRRYAALCTGSSNVSCRDYARVHNGGPTGCRKSSTIAYGDKVDRCYRN